jgi:hypothetical protein
MTRPGSHVLRWRAAALVGVLLAGVCGLSTPAHADKADKLFQKAKRLLADKSYPEACPLFEQVDQIDPGIGAKLNVAKCYEEWGRLAVAYRWYLDAEVMATKAKDERAAKIKELIAELDANVPRVTIRVPAGADPDVLDTLTLDGKPFPVNQLNLEQRVDPGPHLIEFVVRGEKRRKMAPVERGGESEVSLDIPKGTGTRKTLRPNLNQEVDVDPGDDPAEPRDPGRRRRLVGLGVAGAGVVAVGVAVAITLSARGTYRDALADHCMNSAATCDPTGFRLTQDARSTANVATVISLVGGAAVIGGVVLYVTGRKASSRAETQALYITPAIGAHGGGFVVGGSF